MFNAFFIQTLGCKLNQLESEAITDALIKAGFAEHSVSGTESEFPSVIIINTCTVTSKADQKARRVIRKALNDYPHSRIIVTGCYAQLNKDDILALENTGSGRLYVINKDDIINFPQYLFEGSGSRTINYLEREAEDRKNTFLFNPRQFSRHTRCFLKIQDGCDKHCTYCRIRLARGLGISLEKEEVLSRLRVLEQTHAEAVLTGVNICQYREKGSGDRGLTGLLEYLLSETDKIAIRLSSLAPQSVDEELAKLLSRKRIQPHFHLSVQSCSNKILERMGRNYTGETVENAVSLLRRAKDDPFLACDIITGFPGETEVEFEQTFRMIKKLDFAWIHVFPYSRRPGTPAFSFTGNTAESEVKRRVRLFTQAAKQGRADYVRRWLGREVDVLVENKENKKDVCFGTSENYLKVLIKCAGKPAGTLLKCRLIEAGDLNEFDAAALVIS